MSKAAVCSMQYFPVLYYRCFTNSKLNLPFCNLFFSPPDSNSPQVVKKPPVSSADEWSNKRPSDDTVSTISSLPSSPTVSPQGSPRKGLQQKLFTVYGRYPGTVTLGENWSRVDLVKQTPPGRALQH